MSRRLVSYSDLSEDAAGAAGAAAAPSPAGPQQDEAGPSSLNHSKVGTRLLNGNGATNKRKFGASHSERSKHKRRIVRPPSAAVHWDDPSYTPGVEQYEAEAGYRGYVLAEDSGRDPNGTEAEEMDGVDGDDGGGLQQGGVGNWEAYTNWKYDEWGEPYTADSASRLHGEEVYDDDGYEDEPEAFSADDSSDEDDASYSAMLPFAIPDVDEFHRSQNLPTPHTLSSALPPTTTTATTTTTPHHRPPAAVGGGGRILTHAEIYSPHSIISTFNAAMDQYCTLHNLCAPNYAQSAGTGKRAAAALWTDAPAYDSLLAQQVREDTLQALALRKRGGQSGGEDAAPATAASVAAEPGSIVGGRESAAEGQSEGGVAESKRKKSKGTHAPANQLQQQQQQRRGKPIVTHVAHAHLDGNSAWKKALKTVMTTPNRVGYVLPAHHRATGNGGGETNGHTSTAPPPRTPAAVDVEAAPSHSALDANQTVLDGSIPDDDEAVSESKAVQGRSKEEEGLTEAVRQQELYDHWYAGYYAGLAACGATATATAAQDGGEAGGGTLGGTETETVDPTGAVAEPAAVEKAVVGAHSASHHA